MTFDKKSFFQTIKENYAKLKPHDLSAGKLVLNEACFLPIANLTPGQSEISVDNVFTKLKQAQEVYKPKWDESKKVWELGFDDGKSLLPKKDASVLIVGPGQILVMVDGHHHAYMSLYLGGHTVPAVIIEDWRKMTLQQFWTKLEAENRVYLKTAPDVLAKSPPTLLDVKDNPNRYFASLLAARAQLEYHKDAIKVVKIKASGDSVWIKVNEGIPFIEFCIAEVLSGGGLKYQQEWADCVPKESVEKAREVLLKAKFSGKVPLLNNLILLESRETAKAVAEGGDRLIGLVEGFLQQHGVKSDILNDNFSAVWSREGK